MNIRDLEYFYHLYRLHSFTAVSKHCRVSQPTVSYAIKRLEDHFACHLFVKDPSHRNVAFTHQGDIVAKHAEAILTELSVLSKEIHSSKDTTQDNDTSTLNIIVESWNLFLVTVQDISCI